jgi:hypothetical protein
MVHFDLFKEKFEYVGNSSVVTRIEYIGSKPILPSQNYLTVLDEKYIIALCNYTTQWRNYVKEFKEFFNKRNIEHEIFQKSLDRMIDQMKSKWFIGAPPQISDFARAKLTQAVFDYIADPDFIVYKKDKKQKYGKDSPELYKSLGINETPAEGYPEGYVPNQEETLEFIKNYFNFPNKTTAEGFITNYISYIGKTFSELKSEITLPEILLDSGKISPELRSYLESLERPPESEILGLGSGNFGYTPDANLFIGQNSSEYLPPGYLTPGYLTQGGPGKGGKSTNQSKRRRRKATRKQKRINKNGKRKGITKKIRRRQRRTTRKRVKNR